MTEDPTIRAYRDDGIAVVPNVVADPSDIELLRRLPDFANAGRPGSRGKQVPTAVAKLIAPSGPLTTLATRLSSTPARPVRILYFDKTADANWAVPWHQDRTIAVQERRDVFGSDVWSITMESTTSNHRLTFYSE